MPSFLSKVFGRKKGDDKEKEKEPSTPSPLGGKFEAVRLSPSIANFGERRSSGGRATAEGPRKSTDVAPHLSLNLPGVKDEGHRALSLIFGGEASFQTVLSDSAIGERQLSPSEAQLLIQACSEVIVPRGLETLGLMHPHWHSASPDVQRKLISLFLNSLAAKSAFDTLPTSPLSEFHSELGFARTPQDVAAVLRWGLRHLNLEGSQLGKNPTWYRDFYQAEASASYPPKAYTTILSPLIHPPHLQLLSSILNLATYIAAHSEANGISGSKFSKFIGLWLLTNERDKYSDDWKTFYARWETAGRQLEHVFLSQIRDEAADHPVPRRLSELVQQYPYSATCDLDLLPRPQFTTRCYDALLLRIQTTLPGFKSSRSAPLQLIAEALKAQESTQPDSEPHQIWTQIKSAAEEGELAILSDETVRILSIVSNSDRPLSPTFREINHHSSPLASDNDKELPTSAGARATNGHARTKSFSEDSHQPPSASSYSFIGAADWAQFSQSGFLDSPSLGTKLAATLMDKDVEVTEPPPVSIKRSMSRRSTASTIRNRKSMDTPPVPSIPASIINAEKEEQSKPSSIITEASLVELDEAFVDFWHDALGDPIASSWPNFVLAKLKPSVAAQLIVNGKAIEWVVIEQIFTKPPPPPTPAPLMIPSISQQTTASATSSPASRRPAPSPKPSQRSDTSKKRFSFFSTRTSSDRGSKPKKGNKSPVIGEMGEILQEDQLPGPRETKLSTVGEDVASGAVAGVVGGAVIAAAATASSGDEQTTNQPSAEETSTPEAVQVAEEPKGEEGKASEDSTILPALVVPATASQPEIIVEQPVVSAEEPASLPTTAPSDPAGQHTSFVAEGRVSLEPFIVASESGTTIPEHEETQEPTGLLAASTSPVLPTETTPAPEVHAGEKLIRTATPAPATSKEPSINTPASADQPPEETATTPEPAPVERVEEPQVALSEPEPSAPPAAETSLPNTIEVSTPGDASLASEDSSSAPVSEAHLVAEGSPEAAPMDEPVTADNSAPESHAIEELAILGVDPLTTEPSPAATPETNSFTNEPSTEPMVHTQISIPAVEHDNPVTHGSEPILEPKLEQISPQIEPLAISPTTGDSMVTLPAVPVVQAEAETPPLAIPMEAVSGPMFSTEESLPDEAFIEEPSELAPSAVQPIISLGETPGPQAMLDAVEPTSNESVESGVADGLRETDEELALPVTPQVVEENVVAPLTFTSPPVDDGSPSRVNVQLSPIESNTEGNSAVNADKPE